MPLAQSEQSVIFVANQEQTGEVANQEQTGEVRWSYVKFLHLATFNARAYSPAMFSLT